MMPLPEAIAGTEDRTGGFAVSRDGSRLAYTGPADGGDRQIFVANLDGTGAEQVTHGLAASSPAWSPDGSTIAYAGHRGDEPDNIFVLDLATGVFTQITLEEEGARSPSFSPDGSSLVYSAEADPERDGREVRMVPVAGGDSVRLVGGDGVDASDSQLSADGSLLSFQCEGPGHRDDRYDRWDLCLANADGTGAMVLVPGSVATISNARWSPDGTRIVGWGLHSSFVFVVDVATGELTQVGYGDVTTWLDDHTLIVEPPGWHNLP